MTNNNSFVKVFNLDHSEEFYVNKNRVTKEGFFMAQEQQKKLRRKVKKNE